ncbi:MAG: glycosyltransferase family 39 protein [Candidatus Aureabacteria bacterium]|nr:glycosyltransferase family 39 protein [Candidatus Auribacterota bacterium]
MNIFFPRIDERGDTSGIVGETEFPIYSYVVALLYRVFGFNDLAGRLLSLIAFVFSSLYFYKLVFNLYKKETVAVFSLLSFMLMPLVAYYRRAFMLESTMLFFSVALLFHFMKWTEHNKWQDYILALLFGVSCFLIKIPSLVLGLPLLYLSFRKFRWRFFIRPSLWLFGLITLGTTFLWYFHSHKLTEINNLSFGVMSKVNAYGLFDWQILTSHEFVSLMFQRLKRLVFGEILIVFMVLGLFFSRKYSPNKLPWFWLASTIIFIVAFPFMNKGHDYYQILITFPIAIFTGIGLTLVWDIREITFKNNTLGAASLKQGGIRAGTIIILLATLALTVSNTKYFFGNKIEEIYEDAQRIKGNSDKKDLIVLINDYGTHSELFYHSHRKGWVMPITATPPQLKNLIKKGARYIEIMIMIETNSLRQMSADNPLIQSALKSGKIVRQTERSALVKIGNTDK